MGTAQENTPTCMKSPFCRSGFEAKCDILAGAPESAHRGLSGFPFCLTNQVWVPEYLWRRLIRRLKLREFWISRPTLSTVGFVRRRFPHRKCNRWVHFRFGCGRLRIWTWSGSTRPNIIGAKAVERSEATEPSESNGTRRCLNTKRAPDHHHLTGRQRWLQQNLSISHCGRNSARITRYRLKPYLSQSV